MLQLGYGNRSRRRPLAALSGQANLQRRGLRPNRHEFLVQNLTKAIRDPDLVIAVRYIAKCKAAVETDLGAIQYAIAMHIVEVYKVFGKQRLPITRDFSFK